MKSKRTEQTKIAAAELVTKGIPVSQVAKQYGVSTSGVRVWVSKYSKKSTALAAVSPTAPARPDLGAVYTAIGTLRQAGLI